MASGTIKRQKILMGNFTIAISANTMTEVKADTIIDGTLPPEYRYCVYTCLKYSSAFPEGLTISCDGNHLYIKSQVANTLIIRWWDLFALL